MNKCAVLFGFVFPCFVESSCPMPPREAGGLLELTDQDWLKGAERSQEAPIAPRSSAIFG